ncbi:hypothetical protein PR048_008203 [Dryococelus australis]|uniref:SHC SH2 domain-containing protein n=1 Tax=Dryococelus australis TaxID=614101 RepID=A0ABQ9HX81_9NEOP|nr:hypothetical protein PR048_008203 [Dryococelus australis]
MAAYVKTLLQEGKEVHQKIRSLEKVIDDERQEEEAETVDQSRVQALMELHVRQEQIKGEVEWLESPVLRTLIVKKQQKEMCADEILCVCGAATADEIIAQLTTVKSKIKPTAVIKMLSSLQEALSHSTRGQQIFVFPGIHCIKKSNKVEAGHIKGLGGHRVTTVTSPCSGSCLLQVWSREVTLEDLTLDASAVQMALAVSTGVLKLHNCRVISSVRSSCTEGIVVLEGGRLQAIQCKFISFGTAISAKAGADVILESCSISDSHVGILVSALSYV